VIAAVRSAIGLQNIVVDVNRALMIFRSNTERAERPIRRWISLCAPALLAARAGIQTGCGSAGQHPYPHLTFAAAFFCGRDFFLDRSGTLHLGRSNSINTEPSAWTVKWRVVTGRKALTARAIDLSKGHKELLNL
jgi:hypothetical protein